jgi:hypothetical protein
VVPVAGILAAASDLTPAALVAEFELLLDEYNLLRRRDWSPRLAQAHAETNELFGEEYDSENRENANRFFSEACARLNVHEAGERMHAVGEEMKPLAQAIVALPATSLGRYVRRRWSRSGKLHL